MATKRSTPVQDPALVEKNVLEACRSGEWNGAFWFPRVFRELIKFPDGLVDEEIQKALLHLIDTGMIDVGTWNGDAFTAQTATPEVLRDLRRNPGTDLFVRTKP